MQVVSMVLAEGPGHPAGDLEDRLEFRVLLMSSGHLDAAAWEFGSVTWHSAQSYNGALICASELVKTSEGWALRELSGDDAPLLNVMIEVVRPGELVSVSRLDGDVMVYRIVAVDVG